jgi:colanic acid biosynthesis glycosyl transferase WcaI
VVLSDTISAYGVHRPITLPCMSPSIRIAILGINFAPEPTGIAPYTTGLAREMAERGHDVLVLTGQPHYPYWKRRQGDWHLRTDEIIDGVRVRRLNHPIPRGVSWTARAVMEATFGLQLATTRWGRPDVVICVTPPLFGAALSVIRSRMGCRGPAIGVIVQDLYSRGLRETGVTNRVAERMVRGIESLTLRLCDSVSVIHDGFREDLVQFLRVDGHRIRTIRNWTHVNSPDPSASAAFRAAHGWTDDEVVVLHAGNMGYKQGLENVIAAASLAANVGARARFVLLGDGSQRASLEQIGAGLRTLEFLDPVAKHEFPAALGAADVLLVNQRPGIAQMSVQSKLTSYFNSAKPILAATDSDGLTARELASSGAGAWVPANRPDLLLSEAIRLGTNPGLAAELGQAGMRYCAELLSEKAALDRYEQWILDLASAPRSARKRRGPCSIARMSRDHGPGRDPANLYLHSPRIDQNVDSSHQAPLSPDSA